MDPISDMFTRIRNAIMARKKEVKFSYSKMKLEIARVLLEEGYINNFQVMGEGVKKEIAILLKYTLDGKSAISEIKRVSRPSRRVYTKCAEIPKTASGLGITLLSTPKGILSDRQARKERVGGEILGYVW